MEDRSLTFWQWLFNSKHSKRNPEFTIPLGLVGMATVFLGQGLFPKADFGYLLFGMAFCLVCVSNWVTYRQWKRGER
ncbi:MAG TPA: hypothetical protein VGM37_05385 [Armatimonadota bacterium]